MQKNFRQQQQPQQYRQVLNQQQMVGGYRPMGPRQMAPGSQQNQQQFDEVNNFDFI